MPCRAVPCRAHAALMSTSVVVCGCGCLCPYVCPGAYVHACLCRADLGNTGCVVMAYMVMAYIGMAYIGMAYIVTAYIVMASIVMAYAVMA